MHLLEDLLPRALREIVSYQENLTYLFKLLRQLMSIRLLPSASWVTSAEGEEHLAVYIPLRELTACGITNPGRKGLFVRRADSAD